MNLKIDKLELFSRSFKKWGLGCIYNNVYKAAYLYFLWGLIKKRIRYKNKIDRILSK